MLRKLSCYLCFFNERTDFSVFLKKVKISVNKHFHMWQKKNFTSNLILLLMSPLGGGISVGWWKPWGEGEETFHLPSVPRWRRKWQPTPVFLPGESHGWRSLVGCSNGVAQSQTRLKRLSSSSRSSRSSGVPRGCTSNPSLQGKTQVSQLSVLNSWRAYFMRFNTQF